MQFNINKIKTSLICLALLCFNATFALSADLPKAENTKISETGYIGVQLAEMQIQEISRPYISSVYSGSSAEKAGLKVGDFINSVNGVSCARADALKVASLLQGQINTPVNIVIFREGEKITIKAFRNSITPPAKPEIKKVDFSAYMQDLQKRIRANWQPPKGKEENKVTVRFKVNKNGELVKDTLVVKESSSSEAEKAAREAVLTAAPKFIPLPDGSPESVIIEFTFSRTGSQYLKKQEPSPESFDFKICGGKVSESIDLNSWADRKIDCSVLLKINSLLKQAYEEKLNRNYENAAKIYNQILDLNPSEVRAFSGLASLDSSLEEYESSILNYDKAIKLDPHNLTLKLEKIYTMKKSCYSQEEIQAYDEEIEDFKEINSFLKSLDNSPKWQSMLIDREAHLGHLELARKEALRVLELFKKQNHIGGQDYVERFLKALDEHEAKLAKKKKD